MAHHWTYSLTGKAESWGTDTDLGKSTLTPKNEASYVCRCCFLPLEFKLHSQRPVCGWVPQVQRTQSADFQPPVIPGPLKDQGQGQVKDSEFQKIRRSCPSFFFFFFKCQVKSFLPAEIQRLSSHYEEPPTEGGG